MRLEQKLRVFEGQPITQGILKALLKEYRWPHNKIRELEKQDILTPVKRGLYILGPELKTIPPSLYLLANHIYGPSYVSLEGALSFWGMIPEQVKVISSMTTGLTKSFHTPLGHFSYIRARLPYYSFGIRQVELSPTQTILMASPEKALCDIVATRAGVILRSISQTLHFLEEDLRIERTSLQKLDIDMISSWLQHAPKKTSMKMLIKTLNTI